MKSTTMVTMAYDTAHALTQAYSRFAIQVPFYHVVLGSGFAVTIDEQVTQGQWKFCGRLAFTDLPGLPAATVQGHLGQIHYYEHLQTHRTIALQFGRIHGYEGHSPKQVVHPLMAAFFAGTTRFILTNAAGSLTTEFAPGSLMLIADHVNLTGQSPLIGPNPVDVNGQPLGPRFPSLAEVYDLGFRMRMKAHLENQKLDVHQGIYLGLLGPTYETPAEVVLFAQWGMHAVGMSTVWEAIALKHVGARVGGVSLMSNYACGLGGLLHLDHADVLKQCAHSATKTLTGLFCFLDQEMTEI